MVRLSIFLALAYSATAMAAQCPSGFIAAPEYALLVSDTCPAGYISAGEIPTCPANKPCAKTCPIGYLLQTGTGIFAPLLADPAPSPALRISDGTNSCWVELAPGIQTNSINIMQDGQAYYTVQ